MTEILLVLKNLNDKARRCEDTLIDILKTINQLENKPQPVQKHIVVLRKDDTKEKAER
jgi:hypothetical protein